MFKGDELKKILLILLSIISFALVEAEPYINITTGEFNLDEDDAFLEVETDEQGRLRALYDLNGNRLSYFIYDEGRTEVYDAENNRTVYCYDDGQQITAIEKYRGEAEHQLTNYLFWKEGKLSSLAGSDEEKRVVSCQAFLYDGNGNLAEKRLFGNLTGACEAPIILDEEGIPEENGVEQSTARYAFSEEGRLLEKIDESGLKSRYQYDSKSGRLTSALIYDGDTIRLRSFYFHDKQGKLMAIVNDDGSSPNHENLEDVTKRHTLFPEDFRKEPRSGKKEPSRNNDKVEKAEFNARGAPTRILYKDGGEEQIFYTVDGKIKKLVASDGTTTLFSRDFLSRPTKIEKFSPNGECLERIENIYDSFHLIQQIDCLTGEEVQYEYDEMGEPSYSHYLGENGGEMLYRFDENGQMVCYLNNGEVEDSPYDPYSPDPSVKGITGKMADYFYAFSNAGYKVLGALQAEAAYLKHIRPDATKIFEEYFGKGFLQLNGYYSHPMESGTYGRGEVNEKVRISFINGISNVRSYFRDSLEQINSTHGGANIHYIFRPTEGWGWDMLKAIAIKFGYVSPYSKELAALWRSLIDEMGGVGNGGLVIHYCHSLGGADTVTAAKLLTPEERKMIRVVSVGSASMIPDDLGFESATNYVSVRDGVCLLDPVHYIAGRWRPEQSNIHFIGSHLGIPLVDHALFMETYRELFTELGHKFVHEYCF